jgi:hypothetical protein
MPNTKEANNPPFPKDSQKQSQSLNARETTQHLIVSAQCSRPLYVPILVMHVYNTMIMRQPADKRQTNKNIDQKKKMLPAAWWVE